MRIEEMEVKGMLIGYARSSSIGQNEAYQIKALKEMGVTDRFMFVDKQSGKDANRPALRKMLNGLRQGDVVITHSISRIARNTKDLLNIVEEINANGAEFVSLKENIDTRTPQGKFMLTVFGAMATLEREQILEKQREGIAIAKEQGKYKGKPKMEIDEKAMIRECKRWRDGEITATEAMKRVGLKANTFYRRVKEMGL